MEHKEILNKLVEDLKSDLLLGIEDENDCGTVINGFKDELTIGYEYRYKKVMEEWGESYGFLLAFIKNSEEIFKEEPNTRVNYYKFKEIRDKINRYSDLAYKLAVDYNNKGVVSENYRQIYDEVMTEMKKISEAVKDDPSHIALFNKAMSEVVLDLEYAGGKTDNMSLRLMRLQKPI
jgi:hypothetical protein